MHICLPTIASGEHEIKPQDCTAIYLAAYGRVQFDIFKGMYVLILDTIVNFVSIRVMYVICVFHSNFE